jgi:hypothetical protein
MTFHDFPREDGWMGEGGFVYLRYKIKGYDRINRNIDWNWVGIRHIVLDVESRSIILRRRIIYFPLCMVINYVSVSANFQDRNLKKIVEGFGFPNLCSYIYGIRN